MAYEVDIGTSKFDKFLEVITKSVEGVGDLDKAVKGLNGTMGEMRTPSGRLGGGLRPPAEGAGGGEAPSLSPGYSRSLGPRDSINPWRGGGSRQRLMVEQEGLRLAEEAGGDDLIADQRARVRRAELRVASDDRLMGPADIRGGRSSSLDPFSYEGPRSRLARFQSMRDRAHASGDADSAADWDDRVKAAQTHVNRLNNDPDQAKLDMLLTSRIGSNGALYPLVSKVLAAGASLASPEGSSAAAASLKALGIGEGKDLAPAIAQAARSAMPLLIAGGGAALAAGAVIGAAEGGAARMRAANDAFYTMGGSPSGVGTAMALGGENAASKAMQLGDRLRQGSFGSAYFRSQGIYDTGAYQVDKSSNYVRALDALRAEPDVQKRIRIARDTDLTDDLWTSDIKDDRLYRELRDSMGDAGSPGQRQSEAEYRARKAIVGNYWDQGVRAVGNVAMRAVSGGIETAKILGSGGNSGNFPEALGLIDPTGMATEAANGIGSAFGGWAKNLYGGRTAIGRAMRARDKEAAASASGWQNIDRPMGDGPETINGSISPAIPAGWRGRTMNEVLDHQRQLVGGFSV